MKEDSATPPPEDGDLNLRDRVRRLLADPLWRHVVPLELGVLVFIIGLAVTGADVPAWVSWGCAGAVVGATVTLAILLG